MEKKKPTPINIKNKKASFDYEFVDTYTAGIVLTGTETTGKHCIYTNAGTR